MEKISSWRHGRCGSIYPDQPGGADGGWILVWNLPHNPRDLEFRNGMRGCVLERAITSPTNGGHPQGHVYVTPLPVLQA